MATSSKGSSTSLATPCEARLLGPPLDRQQGVLLPPPSSQHSRWRSCPPPLRGASRPHCTLPEFSSGRAGTSGEGGEGFLRGRKKKKKVPLIPCSTTPLSSSTTPTLGPPGECSPRATTRTTPMTSF
ncbi:hypothetical protein FH972_012309 [Carpinus fangiana]|uniref:Uncharacterized protein n=1 Tax=Carpinus fangiana TaxID=176857 RepID=A0A5N6R3E4_9ROSI|nr:hypothetical protein FH972_012309 [Carpinus fangiana]